MRNLIKTTLLAVLALGLAATAQAADAPMTVKGATTVDSAGVVKLVETSGDLVVIDNRKEGDFKSGHIDGAIRLIDTDINGESDLAKVVPTKSTPVLFYCNGLKCGRAAAAAEKAIGYGYTRVYYYAQGMEEWKAKGMPLVTQ